MQKSVKRRVLEVFLLIIAILLFVVVAYVIYVFGTYKRIKDNVKLDIEKPSVATTEQLLIGNTIKITSYNIGFGAYSPEFSFFMDGGKQSVAESKDSVKELVGGAAKLIKEMNPDIALFQEVDTDSTRSHHVNQLDMIQKEFDKYYSAYAVNYDSAFLFYPILEPHGKSKSGIETLSKYEITSALRRSLPISDSVKKILDLDRCFSVSRIPVFNGKELVVINIHASAYGTDDSVREKQVNLLFEVMQKEYKDGNYVICGGDFNHDLLASENDKTDKESWAYPFPRSKMPEGFCFAIDMLGNDERANLWKSCRNADIPYKEGETYTVTVDGFIISNNIDLVSYTNYKTGYKYSDHDPVVMEFKLK